MTMCECPLMPRAFERWSQRKREYLVLLPESVAASFMASPHPVTPSIHVLTSYINERCECEAAEFDVPLELDNFPKRFSETLDALLRAALEAHGSESTTTDTNKLVLSYVSPGGDVFRVASPETLAHVVLHALRTCGGTLRLMVAISSQPAIAHNSVNAGGVPVDFPLADPATFVHDVMQALSDLPPVGGAMAGIPTTPVRDVCSSVHGLDAATPLHQTPRPAPVVEVDDDDDDVVVPNCPWTGVAADARNPDILWWTDGVKGVVGWYSIATGVATTAVTGCNIPREITTCGKHVCFAEQGGIWRGDGTIRSFDSEIFVSDGMFGPPVTSLPVSECTQLLSCREVVRGSSLHSPPVDAGCVITFHLHCSAWHAPCLCVHAAAPVLAQCGG